MKRDPREGSIESGANTEHIRDGYPPASLSSCTCCCAAGLVVDSMCAPIWIACQAETLGNSQMHPGSGQVTLHPAHQCAHCLSHPFALVCVFVPDESLKLLNN